MATRMREFTTQSFYRGKTDRRSYNKLLQLELESARFLRASIVTITSNFYSSYPASFEIAVSSYASHPW